MLQGWKYAYDVIRASAQILVGETSDSAVEMFDIEWIKNQQDALEVKKVHNLAKGER